MKWLKGLEWSGSLYMPANCELDEAEDMTGIKRLAYLWSPHKVAYRFVSEMKSRWIMRKGHNECPW
jgi:hypothetical protein